MLNQEGTEMGSVKENTDTSGRAEPLVVRRQLHTRATVDEMYTDRSEPHTGCDAACKVSPKCIGRHVLNFFPFLRFLWTYQWRSWILGDFISGLSVGFIHLPQGLGFGLLASLSPIHGLYSSFFPVVVYLLFGTCPYISMGTNALIAVLTANLVNREADHFRSLLGANETWTAEEELQYKVGISAASCFVGGVILLGMGIIRFGFLTNFMSMSFIGGFTFSAAVHIATSQIVKMLNINIKGQSGFGKLVKTYIEIFKNITDANPADIIIGVICMVILLAVKIGINERYQHKMKIPVPIELIVIIVSTIISHFAKLHDKYGIGIADDVPTGLPAPTLPDVDSLSRVALDAFITAMLIYTLTISLGKLTAKLHRVTIDDNQELVAYGLCLLVGGFFQNFPACIAPPRTLMLSSLRAKSTLNGVITAVFLLVVLLVAGPLFVSLPIAMLAALIIVAMKDLLVQIFDLKHLWKVNKPDFFIWVVTALFCVFGNIDIGLLVGLIFSMVTVLLMGQLTRGTLQGKATTEDIVLTLGHDGIDPVPGVKIFRFESDLYFASQERFKSQLYHLVKKPASLPSDRDKNMALTFSPLAKQSLPSREDPVPAASSKDKAPDDPAALYNGKEEAGDTPSHVILDCSAMSYIDMAGVDALTLVMTQFLHSGINIWLADVPAGSLGTLQRAGFVDKVGKDKIFFSVMDALQRLHKPEEFSVKL